MADRTRCYVQPRPIWPGLDLSKQEVLVVPDQSLSIQEILDRFTIGEELPIGRGVQYGEDEDMDNPLNVDLEKMADADLVDKAEYTEKLREVQRRYEKQEKAKQSRAAKEAADAERKAIEDAAVERHKKAGGTPAA